MPYPSPSATDAVSPAIHRATAMLFKPFRWSFYWRMAVVAFLTGELGGGCNFHVPANFPTDHGKHRGGSSQLLGSIPWHWPAGLSVTQWIVIGAFAVFTLFAVMLIFLYIASIFRFILFDSVLTGRCSIGENWSRRQREGRKLFQWSLIVMALTFTVLVMVFGTPLLFAWSAGFFENASQHIAVLVVMALVLFLLLVIFMLVAGAVHIITRDIMVPMLAFEDISIGDAWERAKQLIAADKGGYGGFYGMCILLAIAVGIIFGIIGLIILIAILIPIVLIGIVIFGIIAATGWNPVAIALGVLLGVIALIAVMFISALIYVPAVVFRQSFGMYFFGARYAPLSRYMYPPPPAPPPMAPPVSPSPEPVPA
jgi:hypothetical protein